MRPEDFVNLYYGPVYNVALRTLARREDAEDAAQQTFARALPQLDNLRDPAAAGGWIMRIASNTILDELRRRGTRARSVRGDPVPDWENVADPDPLVGPVDALELKQLRVDVWCAALALPPRQRLALALREVHCMSYLDIAEAMGTSVPAVEALLFRARQNFRDVYAGPTLAAARAGECQTIIERLSASIDGELAAGEQVRVDVHLAGCPSCQFVARELRGTSRLYGRAVATRAAAATLARRAT